MATSIVFNGSTYSVPANREPRGWGTSLSAFLVDVGNNALSKAGGNFTLTADANFGPTFGLVAKYIKSVSTNAAQSGVVRLANDEAIAWRNAANDGDILFKVNSSDEIELGGTLRLDEVTVFSDTDKEMDVGETLFNSSSTGCSQFDGFTITGGGTTFTVGAGSGQVVDHETDQVINVSWSAFTGKVALTTDGVTHVYITRDAAVVTTLTLPDGTVRRDNIVLGRVGSVGGTIISAATTTVSAVGIGGTLVDHMEAISAFRVSGIAMTPNGANLNINRSAGSIFRSGVNFVADAKNPNVRTVTAATPVTLLYTTSTTFVGNSAVVLPGNYESAPGVVTAYAGATNQATIQRIYQYPGASLTTAVQYGTVIYGSLSAAIQAIGTETFSPNASHADNAVLVAILCVTKGCTSLSDTTTARIFVASRFGESSVGASGTSVSTLQNVYTNSADPEITTDSTRGALTVKRGSAADTDNVLEVQNAAGSTTFSVKGNGAVSVSSLTSPTVTGDLLLQNTSGAQPTLQLSEDPDNGTNKVILQAPATLSADYTLTLPVDDGTANQILQTDGSGVLSWTSPLTNPMTTVGDIIVGGASGASTRLPTSLLGEVVAEAASATATMTIATPCVVTLVSHGRETTDKVYFTTTGALPTGVTANTTYYVIKIDANAFNLATSAANAVAGTKVSTSGSQSGTHTVFYKGLVVQKAANGVPGLISSEALGAEGDLGTVTINGGTWAGLSTKKYRWVRNGKMVTFWYRLEGTSGSSVTNLSFALPSDAPAPSHFSTAGTSEWAGWPGSASSAPSTAGLEVAAICNMFRTVSGNDIYHNQAASNSAVAFGCLSYITA